MRRTLILLILIILGGWSHGVGTVAPPYTGPGDINAYNVYFSTRAFSSATRGTKLLNACNSTGGVDVACADLSSDPSTGNLVPAAIGGITCPGPNCTVKTWYDLTGNGNNVTEATVASRPTFQTNAFSAGRTCLAFNGSQTLVGSTDPWNNAPYTLTFVGMRTGNTSNYNSVIQGSGSSPPNIGFSNQANSVFETNGVVVMASAVDNVPHAVQLFMSLTAGNNSSIFVDGALTSGLNPGLTTAFGNLVISLSGQNLTGVLCEVGSAPLDATANNVAINSNQTNWFITPAGSHCATAVSGVHCISPTGSDSNSGNTYATAWATPNHAVNCGDIIYVNPGSYAGSSFDGTFGTVSSCPSGGGSNFATLICDGTNLQSCTATQTSSGGHVFYVTKSNWWVQGFTGIANVQFGACFDATPASGSIHHIVFVNNYAKNCGAGVGGAAVDYVAWIGLIAYGGAGGGGQCFSGMSVYEPVALDSNAGTHIYWSGLFSVNNSNAPSGAGCTDGEGFIADDWDHTQNTPHTPYNQQYALEQSMFIGNGGPGIEVFSTGQATGFINQVTTYGNMQDSTRNPAGGGDFLINSAALFTLENSIMQSDHASNGGSNLIYGLANNFGNTNIAVNSNYYFGVSGQNYNNFNSPQPTFTGNTTSSPGFANPTIPSSAPDCSASTTTTACASNAGWIANFTPSGGAATKGYQPPGSCTANSLWPTWVPVASIPANLVTHPCS